MSREMNSRITSLETRLMTRTCTTCYGHPTQIIGLDDDGETVNGVRYPDDHCPDCGRACAPNALTIAMPFEEFWNPEPFNWVRGR